MSRLSAIWIKDDSGKHNDAGELLSAQLTNGPLPPCIVHIRPTRERQADMSVGRAEAGGITLATPRAAEMASSGLYRVWPAMDPKPVADPNGIDVADTPTAAFDLQDMAAKIGKDSETLHGHDAQCSSFVLIRSIPNLPLHALHTISRLCAPAAAISSARLAVSCPLTCRRSGP